MRRLICSLVPVTLLAACATPDEAQRSMAGMTRAEVLACAGAPSTEAADGSTHVMAYRDAIDGDPCTATVLLGGGRVERISYRGAPGICARMLKGCMRP